MPTKMAKMATDMAKRHGQMVLDASYDRLTAFAQEQVAWQRRLRRRQRLDQRLACHAMRRCRENDVISKKRTVITSWQSRR